MDRLTREGWDRLIQEHPQEEWLVSLYLPMVRAGKEVQQNSTRFKNLLREAEKKLAEKGLRDTEIKSRLEPAEKLIGDSRFWDYQSDGLAAFFSPDEFFFYRLPLDFEETAKVTRDGYYIRPLIPLRSGEGPYFLLALSQNQIRFFSGHRLGVREIEVEGMPTDLAEALRHEEPRKQLQMHSGGRKGKGEQAAAYHGHGGGATDEDKDRILRFFREVDRALHSYLQGQNAPLVLAGVDFEIPLYQKANTYPQLWNEAVEGNPENWKASELHEKAWPLVQPFYEKTKSRVQERLQNALGSDRTGENIEEILNAAYEGRVDCLFLPEKGEKVGAFSPEGKEVADTERPEDYVRDLYNYAALLTLKRRGMVFNWNEEQSDLEVAALYRY